MAVIVNFLEFLVTFSLDGGCGSRDQPVRQSRMLQLANSSVSFATRGTERQATTLSFLLLPATASFQGSFGIGGQHTWQRQHQQPSAEIILSVPSAVLPCIPYISSTSTLTRSLLTSTAPFAYRNFPFASYSQKKHQDCIFPSTFIVVLPSSSCSLSNHHNLQARC